MSAPLVLKPAMTLRSFISFLKRVPKGTPISYGRRYYTNKETTIASIPIGYADGINRKLTNRGRVLFRGKKYPIAGTVCMDQIMIDLNARQTSAKIGDRVTMIGKEGEEEITAWDIARILETIPYEVCCAVSERVPRKYING
jgi:alanine racemase